MKKPKKGQHGCDQCTHSTVNQIGARFLTRCTKATEVIARHGKGRLHNWIKHSGHNNTCSFFKRYVSPAKVEWSDYEIAMGFDN